MNPFQGYGCGASGFWVGDVTRSRGSGQDY